MDVYQVFFLSKPLHLLVTNSKVSSPTRQNTAGLKLLSSARTAFNLPSTTPFIHFETTDYFTPDGRDYPMPHNNVFVQVKSNASQKDGKLPISPFTNGNFISL